MNEDAMKQNEVIMSKDQRILTLEENDKLSKLDADRLEKEISSLNLKLK